MQVNPLQNFLTDFVLLEECVNSMNLQHEDTRSLVHKKALLFLYRYSSYISSDTNLKNRFRAVETQINTLVKIEDKKIKLQPKPSFVPTLVFQKQKSCNILENLDALNKAINVLKNQSTSGLDSFDNHSFYVNVCEIIKSIIYFRKNDLYECDVELEETFAILQDVLNNPIFTKNFSEEQICYLLEMTGKKLHYLDLSLNGSAVTSFTFLTIVKYNINLKSLKLCAPLHFDQRYHVDHLDFSRLKKDALKQFLSLKQLKHLEIYHSKKTHFLAYYLPTSLETLVLKLDNSIKGYLSNNFGQDQHGSEMGLVDADLSCLNRQGEYNEGDLLHYVVANSSSLTFVDFRKTHLSLDTVNFILSNCTKLKDVKINIKNERTASMNAT